MRSAALESPDRGTSMSRFSQFCLYCLSDDVPRRSLAVALIVGAVLNLINQGDALFGKSFAAREEQNTQRNESCPGAQFDAFTLSNIGDGADQNYLRRLRSAISHAAAPGATVVTRSFSDPKPGTGPNLAAEDRSLLWGVVEVKHI